MDGRAESAARAADAAIDGYVGQIAGALLADAERLALDVAVVIAERVPELAAEPVLGREIAASTRANVLRFLSAVATSPGVDVPADVPPEALDLARTFVRRGIDLEVLAHVYRWGQNVAWQRWMQEALALVPTEELPAVLDRSATMLFAFVDGVLRRMNEQVAHERAQLTAGVAARREQTIRLLLDGAPVQLETASQRLDYRLDAAHTAVVIWADPAAEPEQGALESLAVALSQAGGARAMLTTAPGRHVLWAWIASPADVAGVDGEERAERGSLGAGSARAGLPTATLEAVAGQAHEGIRVAVGGQHAGIAGFRRSHEEALAAQQLLAGGARRFVAYPEVEVIALMAGDAPRLREFVAETLAPLRAAGNAPVLLETLRVYLREGGNAATTAALLGTHRNTVLSRVSRAAELLGVEPGRRRLSLQVALEADHYLG